MTLNTLQYFVTIADIGNLTKASEYLNISPSSLSFAIKSLEDELGVPLFDRVGRGIVLNKYGNAYLGYAKRILITSDEAVAYLSEMQHSRDTSLFIADNTNSFASNLISAFIAAYPDIPVHRSFCSAKETVSLKLPEQYDFILGSSNNIKRPDLVSDFVRFGTTVYAVINRSNPLSRRESLTLSDIREESFLTYASGLSGRIMLDTLFGKINAVPKIVFEGNSPQSMAPALSRNIGILLLSGPSAKFNTLHAGMYDDCTAIKVLDCHYESNTSLFYSPTVSLSKAAKLFRSFSFEFAERYGLME